MIKLTCTEEDVAVLKKEKDYNPFPQVRRRCEVVYLKSQGFKNKGPGRQVVTLRLCDLAI